MGWIPKFKAFIPFATEAEYIVFFKETEERKEGKLRK
jgi:hypothetical protein